MEQTICPLDNRYIEKIKPLLEYFSYEYWIKYRLFVELKYFELLYNTLPELKNNISREGISKFMILYNTNISDIIDIEKTTLHDIKAIEVFLRKQYDNLNIGPKQCKEFIHFGLTSQDINSVAFSLQLNHSITECILPKFNEIVELLSDKSKSWKSVTMMALTHGQPAIPTTLGKEMDVFIERILYSIEKLNKFEYHTKIGGAVGTLAAHYKTYPDYDWTTIFNNFCISLDLKRWKTTTQITNYEDIIELSQILIRINNVLIDFCQDIWLYISNKIFILKKEISTQVGSSTMPQKVNPINFENAEGNLKLANSGLEFFVSKLPISRLQRDLTDSTVLRNYGMYLGYTYLSLINIITGINQLEPNLKEIKNQLNQSPEIMSEAIQCILRKNGIEDGYDIIRLLTQTIQFDDLNTFKQKIIDKLIEKNVTKTICDEILALDFNNYLGYYNI